MSKAIIQKAIVVVAIVVALVVGISLFRGNKGTLPKGGSSDNGSGT